MQPALLELYIQASEKWHRFLHLHDEDDSMTTGLHASDPTIALSSTASKHPLEPGPLSADTAPAKRVCIDLTDTGRGDAPSVQSKSTSRQGSFDLDEDILDIHQGSTTPSPTRVYTSQSPITLPASETQSDIGPFVHLTDHPIIVCKHCHFAYLAQEAGSHLKAEHPGITAKERKSIITAIQGIPGLIQDQAELLQWTLQWENCT